MSTMLLALTSLPSTSSAPRRGRRVIGRALSLVAAAAAALLPALASADTGAPLPQGYTSDIQPQAAPSRGPAMRPVNDEGTDEYADTDPSALSDFREPLAPYGAWTEDPTYGTVWVPNADVVGADFAPYQTAGHWALDDNDEWMWVSDYDWGYIPFHYGRWVWAGSSWAWIPGRTYAPAWVTWRVGDGGYLGWAPLPPAYYWAGGVAVGLWTVPVAAFCFVPTAYVFHSHVSTYVIRDRAYVRAAAASTRAYQRAGVASGRGAYRPASPTLNDAHVPSHAAPRGRASADPRAAAFSTRSSTAAVRRGGSPAFRNIQPAGRGRQAPAGRGFEAPRGVHPSAPSRPHDTWAGHHGGFSRSPQAPVLRTPSRGAPHVSPHASPAGRPSFHAPSVQRPSGGHAAPRSVGRSGGGRRR